MALVSNLLDSSPSPSKVKAYKISVSSKVNTDTAVVNSSADSYHQTILATYDRLAEYFQKLGEELKNAKANVTGSKIKSKLNKAGTACINQGKYCKDRKDDCKQLYEFAKLEQRVQALENMVITNNSSK